MTTLPAKLQLRRDDAADWATKNSLLAASEPGVETDTNKWKLGDGTTLWNDLPYVLDPVEMAAVLTALGSVDGDGVYLSDDPDNDDALILAETGNVTQDPDFDDAVVID